VYFQKFTGFLANHLHHAEVAVWLAFYHEKPEAEPSFVATMTFRHNNAG
jgi:hypothetical protein